jgi:hypothetical protein
VPVEKWNYLLDARRRLARFIFFCASFTLRGARWHAGQKWLLRPATIILLIFAPQRKHFSPSPIHLVVLLIIARYALSVNKIEIDDPRI